MGQVGMQDEGYGLEDRSVNGEEATSSSPLLDAGVHGKGAGEHCEEGEETSRLELLSDAVFSIIATIGILPVMETLKEEYVPEFGEIVRYLYIYVLVFILVAVKYQMHCSEFRRADNIGGLIIVCNFLYLGLLALYPFLTSLLVAFPTSPNPPAFAAILFLVTETVYLVLLAAINYRTKLDRRTGSLFIRVKADTSSFVNFLVAAAAYWLFSFCLSGVMFLLAFVNPTLALSVFLALPLCNRILYRILFWWNRAASQRFEAKNKAMGLTADPDAEKLQWSRRRQMKINLSVERSSAFTDGMFAIAVTLVAVNIRAPEGEITDTDSINVEALQEMMPQFASYFIAFALLTYLWYWNNLLLGCFKAVPFLSFWSNILSLMCVGLVPAAIEVVFAYEFAVYAAGLVCGILMWFSMFQLLLMLKLFEDPKLYAEGVHIGKVKKALMCSVPGVQFLGGLLGFLLAFIPGTVGVVFGLLCPSLSIVIITVVFFFLDPRLRQECAPGFRFSLPGR